jgi:hypothetical protein
MLRHLNDRIRAGKDNVYKLHCPMRKNDKAPFLDAFLSLADIWTPEQKQIVRERTLGKDAPRSDIWENSQPEKVNRLL